MEKKPNLKDNRSVIQLLADWQKQKDEYVYKTRIKIMKIRFPKDTVNDSKYFDIIN